MKNIRIKTFETALGYTFKDVSLLKLALTHRSAHHTHNERLEFLGDAILNCVVGEFLFEKFGEATEGSLSRIRANLVCQQTLFEIAVRIGIPEVIILGSSELNSGGHQRPSTLADALEAVLGAIFHEGGFDAVRHVIRTWFMPLLKENIEANLVKDEKSQLQEILQGRRLALPIYTVLSVKDLEQSQLFKVSCEVTALKMRAEGNGASRRAAEREAAGSIVKLIQEKMPAQKGIEKKRLELKINDLTGGAAPKRHAISRRNNPQFKRSQPR